MKFRKTLTILLSTVLLAACTRVENEQAISTETTAPETPIITNTFMQSTSTIHHTAATSPTIIVPAEVTPTPSATQTSIPYDRVTRFNSDGSWYYEYEPYTSHTIHVFQTGNPLPLVYLHIYAYYPNYPDLFEYPAFQSTNSPVAAIWYEPVWSPNGRYLAFLGAIEGPSSDLYVFDTVTETVTRLTSGENQTIDPEWSPDSQWIIHGEMFDGHGDDGISAVWAVRPDSSEVRWLFAPHGWPEIIGWIDESSFYTADHRIIGYTALRIIDLDHNEIITAFDLDNTLCGSVLTTFVFDPESGALFYEFSLFDECTELADGLYLTTPWAPSPRLMYSFKTGSYHVVHAWDQDLGVYIGNNNCEDDPNLYFSVTPQGEVFCIEYNP